MRLALGPLAAALLLEVAFGDVVADAIARDVVQRVGFRDIFRAGADDGGDLDFPVQFGGFSRLLDCVIGAGKRGVGLQEKDRLGRNRVSRLLGVVAVIQPDRDEFGDAGDGRAESGLARNGGERGGVDRGQLFQRGRRIGLAVESRMCADRSRNWPDLSIRPGFSAPFSP